MPIEDTLRALDELVRAGKVREIGCSNFSADLLREAEEAARDGSARFASVQNEYSLLHRDPENDVIPESKRADIALVPYFPLANGLLTGKYRQGWPAPRRVASGPPGCVMSCSPTRTSRWWWSSSSSRSRGGTPSSSSPSRGYSGSRP
jgi:aryl-alcohol dehydrogenase-like predicted oxidoreductase